MIALRETLLLILNIVQFVVLAHVIISWLVNFQVLNLRQPLVAQIWNALNQTLEPLYRQVRRVVPITSGIDFAPLVVLILIFFLQRLLVTGGM